MNWLLWLIGAVFIGAALWAVYRSFQNPKFVARLTAYVTSSAFKALAPHLRKVFARKSATEEALDRQAYRENVVRPDKWHKHPGESDK